MRQLTVSYVRYDSEFGDKLPYLRIKGRWLAKLGWQVGLKVSVEASESAIVIRKKETCHDQASEGVPAGPSG